jgi:hypothetical protein
MDTFKDKQQLENLWGTGTAPWEVWKENHNKGGIAKTNPRRESPCAL